MPIKVIKVYWLWLFESECDVVLLTIMATRLYPTSPPALSTLQTHVVGPHACGGAHTAFSKRWFRNGCSGRCEPVESEPGAGTVMHLVTLLG